jgi:thioredoxin reductase (NADPH)
MSIYDLVIVGGGPSGLSAAINGASELARVLLLDSGKKMPPGGYRRQLGGQAIGSSRIENYPGFPEGISGCELMERFERQALALGTEIRCPEHASSLTLLERGLKQITTREGSALITKSVILGNGLSYRKLQVPGVVELLGKGVLYGAPTANAHQLGKCTACVVGGANSAGQAVMFLSQNPDCSIKLLVRGKNPIESQMSKYLSDRIYKCPNVEIVLDVSVSAAHGTDRLDSLTLRAGDGREQQIEADHLFVFIGADPKTEWLKGAVMMDSRNFIATGNTLGTLHGPKTDYETSMPGVFAAGDIRYGSVKRVAAGAGEGSAAVAGVHRYLANPSA